MIPIVSAVLAPVVKGARRVALGPNHAMSISEEGIALIKRFEALRLVAYQDEAGIWTVGWGATKDVTKHTVITPTLAEEWLRRDLLVSEKGVRRFISAKLSQNQYDALVSFTFNCGVEALRISTLRRLLNKGDYQSVPAQLNRWVKVKVGNTHKISNGLVKRRRLEGELFSRGVV